MAFYSGLPRIFDWQSVFSSLIRMMLFYLLARVHCTKQMPVEFRCCVQLKNLRNQLRCGLTKSKTEQLGPLQHKSQPHGPPNRTCERHRSIFPLWTDLNTIRHNWNRLRQ